MEYLFKYDEINHIIRYIKLLYTKFKTMHFQFHYVEKLCIHTN